MKKNGFKVSIIFGDMGKEERDEMMEKFRNQEINFVITTNMLARGIDIPEIELVINFDVPKVSVNGVFKPDYENYQHRIGRAGRFGVKGMAITLFDNNDDETIFRKIIEHFKLQDSVKVLSNTAQIKSELEIIQSA